MIKVIKQGNPNIKEIKCLNCNSILEYNKKDINFYKGTDGFVVQNIPYIKCPICNKDIVCGN